jgi:hypothetical protein
MEGGGAAFAENVILLRVVGARARRYRHDRVVVGVGDLGFAFASRSLALLFLAGVVGCGLSAGSPGLVSLGEGR